MLRFGLLSRLELRVGLAYAGLDQEYDLSGDEQSLRGMAPLLAGIKWNVLHGLGMTPSLALIASVELPQLASDDFNDGNVMSAFKLAGSWKLSNTFGLGFNVGSTVDWEESNWTPLYTVVLNIGILEWMGAYVEIYGFMPVGEYSEHSVDAGLLFPVRHNLQFDISGGLGVSKNSQDGYGSVGISWRIPQ